MITYLPDENRSSAKFSLSYQELKEHYDQYISLEDNEFRDKLAEIMHFAVFVCWVKELSVQSTCGDYGILHMLAHAIHVPNDLKGEFKQLRKEFEEQLRLS